MMTLRLFSGKFESVPAATSWYLADLGEARGKQELFTRQSPKRLKALREHALIESAVSSNRIEGVEVEQSRIATIVFGQPLLRDRDEEEVRGYRQALTWIHEQGAKIPISEETVLQLHHIFFPSSRWPIGNSSKASANSRAPRVRKRVSFFMLSTVLSVLSA
ncbi:MAG: hypothetical protein ACOZF0_15355 [Thermodesulfobacteriota bacterium]